MHTSPGTGPLHQLARLYGVQTAYYDVTRQRRCASAESLLAILQSLGAPVSVLEDVPSALREYQQDRWRQLLEPVLIDWNGEPLNITLRLPEQNANAYLTGRLTMETGEQQRWKWDGSVLPVSEVAEIEGIQYIVKQITLPVTLPPGYHRFTLETNGKSAEMLIITAPLKAYDSPEESESRTWGVFFPLYALHTRRSWGAGDFSDLQALSEWVAEMGGSIVATLPLLATFLDKPFDPSPYAPVSRLMWNEFYIDINSIPELQKCPSAQAMLSSSSFQEEITVLKNSPLVDYKNQMVLKRRILEELCRCCFAQASDRRASLQHFVEANPLVEDYARFRAVQERMNTPWTSWPQPLREGMLKEGDYDEEIKRYYLYVQWVVHQQIETLSEKVQDRGLGLYLDFPLGVHSEGFDVWRKRNIFATKASGGAPPDVVFTKGQNWDFPPLHPERLRQQGYSYYISCLRHSMRHANTLRIDHVMGLHRLFWVPRGMEADQGAYVRYRPDEFYAILTLESQRNKTVIVGEDLGTVPSYVRQSMNRYGLHCMYVMQYEFLSDSQKPLRSVPANVVASMDTHDMPPFAAFWQGLDIRDRHELGLLDKKHIAIEKEDRNALKETLVSLLKSKGWIKDSSPESILKACWTFLSTSPARIVLVNLEDLWLEKEPQNVPSTNKERPNWQRKARFALEAFSEMPDVKESLQELNRFRKYQNKGVLDGKKRKHQTN